MARIRTIKPEFWTDDSITECSLSARLLFIGIWNFADDNGNIERSSKQIKARVFPLDNIDCEPLLIELLVHRLLLEYVVDDKKYLHIRGFAKHQVINRPSKPTCPEYDITHCTLTEYSLSTQDGRERKGKERKGGEDRSAEIELPADLNQSAWNTWIEYRKSIKKPIKDASKETAMKAMVKYGEDQMAVVEQSIANGWQGLFDLKTDKKKATQPQETQYQTPPLRAFPK